MHLPNYAQRANPARLVRLFCKGKCSRTVCAEMTTDRPAWNVLRDSREGDFTAVCLVCRKATADPYNWHP
jgi:hypothetical protein